MSSAMHSVANYIQQLIKSGQWHIGLIIGQLSSQKDYAVRLIRSPDPVEEEEECEEEEEEETGAVVVKKLEKSNRPANLDQADDQWIATHAKQVTRMLPGGIDVIGIFALAPPDMMQKSATKLRQIIFAVHKALSKYQLVERADAITDRIVLQICALSQKIICRTFDVTDNRSSARPAEWKYHTTARQWCRLDSQVAVDLTIAVPEEGKSMNFLKNMMQGIKPFCQAVWNGMATLNGSFPDLSEPIDPGAKKSKGKEKTVTIKEPISVGLLIQMKGGTTLPDLTLTNVKSVIAIRGLIQARAYVHGRATKKESIEVLKADIVRTLASRCELLCEDLEVLDEDGAKELYDTPIRVFTNLPDAAFDFCDYMFKDELVGEVIDRFKELLDVEVTKDTLELQMERVAAEEDWSPAPSMAWTLSSSASLDSSGPASASSLGATLASKLNQKQLKSTVGVVLGSTVALLAVVVSYLLYLGDS